MTSKYEQILRTEGRLMLKYSPDHHRLKRPAKNQLPGL